MAFKSRTEPPNLKRLIFLNKRMVLREKEKQYYSRQCGKSCVNKFEINPPWQELG